MPIANSITVRNPPATKPYVMRATFPLPKGADPSTLGNSFLQPLQQYRKIASLRSWDIYEWMVWNRGQEGRGTNPTTGEPFDRVEISNIIRTITRGKGGDSGNFRSERDRTRPPGYGPGPINSGAIGNTPDGIMTSMVSMLDEPDAVYLEIKGLGNNDVDVVETVPLSGPQLYSVRHGDLRLTSARHRVTTHFGGVHYWWDITRGSNDFRLTINLHNGIPRREVLIKSIALRVRGTTAPGSPWKPPIANYDASYNGRWNMWTEWNDPALGVIASGPDNGIYLLMPDGGATPTGRYYLVPRMAQRAWRVVMWPAKDTGAPQPGQDEGWGVGDWSQGGFQGDELKVPQELFAHLTADQIRSYVSTIQTLNSELAQLKNSEDRNPDGSPKALPQSMKLFPAVGQMYGGPTGAADKYKPYPGIKALACNERLGLLEHKILELRHMSRSWTALYDPNGLPTRGYARSSSGSAPWSLYIGNGKVFGMSSVDQYGAWQDQGFGFSSAANTINEFGVRGPRKLGQRLPDELAGEGLQTQAVNRGWTRSQGWDCWDQQHRQIGWAHSLALAWLDADPLSIMYLTGEAELASLVYWSLTGLAAGTWSEPSVAGETVAWGRDVGWSMYAIARAIPFVGVAASDSEDTTNLATDRGAVWATGPLRRFVAGSELAQNVAGLPWAFASGKAFQMAPFDGNYWVHQMFEVAYISNALGAAHDALGEGFFRSTRYVGAYTNPRAILASLDAGVYNLGHTEHSWLQAASVAAGGSGYATGQYVFVVHDDMRYPSTDIATPNVDARLNLTAAAGVVTALAVATPGAYKVQPFTGTGLYVYAVGTGLTFVTHGSGYQVNNILTVEGGTPLYAGNTPQKAQIKITSMSGSTITGYTFVNTGKYEVPPGAGSILSGGSGSGATATLALSAAGSGLRVTPTWGTPFDAHSGLNKMLAVRKYPTGAAWATRSEWTGIGDYPPRDLCNRSNLDAEGHVDNAIMEFNSPDHENMFSLMLLAGGAKAITMTCEHMGVQYAPPDGPGILTKMRARGLGTSQSGGSGAKIENWWPLYAVVYALLNP